LLSDIVYPILKIKELGFVLITVPVSIVVYAIAKTVVSLLVTNTTTTKR
jgi:hypothetical protein